VTDFKQNHSDGLVMTMDEMSRYLQATTQCVWFPVGQRPLVLVSPQRDCQHWYGALCLDTGQEVALSALGLHSQMTCHFLAHLLTAFPTQPILLFLEAFGDVPFVRPGIAVKPFATFWLTILACSAFTSRRPALNSIHRSMFGKRLVKPSATTTTSSTLRPYVRHLLTSGHHPFPFSLNGQICPT